MEISAEQLMTHASENLRITGKYFLGKRALLDLADGPHFTLAIYLENSLIWWKVKKDSIICLDIASRHVIEEFKDPLQAFKFKLKANFICKCCQRTRPHKILL